MMAWDLIGHPHAIQSIQFRLVMLSLNVVRLLLDIKGKPNSHLAGHAFGRVTIMDLST